MFRLIKAELFKLFKNRTFRILCLVSFLLAMLILIMTSPLMEDIIMKGLENAPAESREAILNQMGAASSEQVVQGGQLGFHLVAKDPLNPTAIEVYHSSFGAGAIEILIGILVAALMAKEYSEGTIKNTLAYGKKRSEFYIAKFLAMVVGVIVLLLMLIIIPTVGTTIMNGWGQTFEISQFIGMLGSFIAAVIANSAVVAIIMIVATLIKSNGGTIGVTVGVFILIPTILGFFYGTYQWFDKLYELTPFYNSALATSIYTSNGDLIKSIGVALVTIIIGLGVGVHLFKKQDIK